MLLTETKMFPSAHNTFHQSLSYSYAVGIVNWILKRLQKNVYVWSLPVFVDYSVTLFTEDLTRPSPALCGLSIALLLLFLSLCFCASPSPSLPSSPSHPPSSWCQPPVCVGPPKPILCLLAACHVQCVSGAMVKEIRRLVSSAAPCVTVWTCSAALDKLILTVKFDAWA